MRRPEPAPPLGVREGLLAGGGPPRGLQLEAQVLAEVEAHADAVPVEAHDVWRVGLVGNAISPGQLVVGNEQLVAALAAEPGLERHEHARGRAMAGEAVGEQQLDASDDAAAEAHVRGERPFGQGDQELFPERLVVPIAEPDAAVRGLELDEGQ